MDIFQRVIIEPFEKFFERVIEFLPNFLASILLLLAGIVLGAILKFISLRFFRAVHLDKFSQRSGFAEVLQKGGIKNDLSALLSKMIGGITVFTFIIISLNAINIPTVGLLLERFFLYLPNVFVAGIILFFGYLLSNFIGRTALITSVNAGLKVSGLISKLVQLAIFSLAATMALEQLGIGKATVLIAFAIIFGGVVLALAIAFGFGGRDIAREYLEKKFKDEEMDDIEHI